MIYYAGIGARKTPEDVCRKMFKAGKAMAQLGFCLRSGGAKGADTAFEQGALEGISDPADVPRLLEIYLPFQRFNGNASPRFGTTKEARAIAKEYHPRWDILSCLGRDFMARNVFQVLGGDLVSPASFILCWTPGGKVEGGTGQALRIAQDRGIPILNFATHDDEYISDFIYQQAEGQSV